MCPVYALVFLIFVFTVTGETIPSAAPFDAHVSFIDFGAHTTASTNLILNSPFVSQFTADSTVLSTQFTVYEKLKYLGGWIYYAGYQTQTMIRSNLDGSISIPIPDIRFLDWTLCNEEKTFLFTTGHSLYSIPLAGATTSTPLFNNYTLIFDQVACENGTIYLTTQTELWTCKPDGSNLTKTASLRNIADELDCYQITFENYIYPWNGSVYSIVTCEKMGPQYVSYFTRISPEGNISFAELLTSQTTSAGYFPEANLVNFFPESGFFTWRRQAISALAQFSFSSSFTFSEDILSVFDTNLISSIYDEPMNMMLVFQSKNSTANEIASSLHFCNLAGSFNGNYCECSENHYGETCNTYCSSDFNCENGLCLESGECQCNVGYNNNSTYTCTLNGVPPMFPSEYATSFTTNSSILPGEYNYYYSSQDFEISTQSSTNSSIYDFYDYTSGHQTARVGSQCWYKSILKTFPTQMFSSETLLVRNISCPLDPQLQCSEWFSPSTNTISWTTELNGTSAYYMEIFIQGNSSVQRIYNLANTSFSSLPNDWNQISGCEACISDPSKCATRSVTPTPTKSHSSSVSRTPYPGESSSLPSKIISETLTPSSSIIPSNTVTTTNPGQYNSTSSPTPTPISTPTSTSTLSSQVSQSCGCPISTETISPPISKSCECPSTSCPAPTGSNMDPWEMVGIIFIIISIFLFCTVLALSYLLFKQNRRLQYEAVPIQIQ